MSNVRISKRTGRPYYVEGNNIVYTDTGEVRPMNNNNNSYSYNGGSQHQAKPRGRRKTGCVSGSYTLKTDSKHRRKGDVVNYIRGYRPDPHAKSGFQSILCSPLGQKSKREVKNKQRRDMYENWVATVQDSLGKRLFNAIYNKQKNLVTIPDLNMLLSPKGQGYCGLIRSRK